MHCSVSHYLSLSLSVFPSLHYLSLSLYLLWTSVRKHINNGPYLIFLKWNWLGNFVFITLWKFSFIWERGAHKQAGARAGSVPGRPDRARREQGKKNKPQGRREGEREGRGGEGRGGRLAAHQHYTGAPSLWVPACTGVYVSGDLSRAALGLNQKGYRPRLG